MARIVPVFIFFDEASIYAFPGSGVPSRQFSLVGGGYRRRFTKDPSNSGLSLRSIWSSFLQKRGQSNAPKPHCISG